MGSTLSYFWGWDRDIDNNGWNTFINDEVKDYNVSNPVYIKISTGTLSATYTLPAGNQNNIIIDNSATNPYWLIQFPGTNNSHSGDQWGWIWNTTTGETMNAVAIGFKRSAW